jgi:hypothetical protein
MNCPKEFQINVRSNPMFTLRLTFVPWLGETFMRFKGLNAKREATYCETKSVLTSGSSDIECYPMPTWRDVKVWGGRGR